MGYERRYRFESDHRNGNMTTLYQSIAKDVFGEEDGICFCTEDKQNNNYMADCCNSSKVAFEANRGGA